ncbi:NAD(P)H-binding protein [Salinicola endophyticus]|uniref:NAD(P)H-binding protein n=1 Tax=Salinicola endophyticus TaxID=1949083 RepID=A0AB74UDA0_9GAMM
MKLVILGAKGMVGSRLIAEARRRGHDVLGVSRSDDANVSEGASSRRRLDVATQPEVLREIIRSQDVVISALRPAAGRESELPMLTRAVVEAAYDERRPVLVVGGAANLQLSDCANDTVLSRPGFLPDSVRPIAEACAAQEAYLATSSAHWLCLRPAAELVPGERTGNYVLGRSRLVTNAQGRSRISVEDYAVAMLDLAVSPAPWRTLLAVGWG